MAALLGGRLVATAESCTAGRIAESLAAVPGAADFLRGGMVAYQDDAKRRLLGVTASSVLSIEAAVEMARGASRLFGVEVAVATTGVAGGEPIDGVQPGTVFIATSVDGHARADEHHFEGSPTDVCEQACCVALAALAASLRDRSVTGSRGSEWPRSPVG